MYAIKNRWVTMVALAMACALSAGCNGSKESSTKQGVGKDSGSAPALDLKATTAQLMGHVLDPHADIVWAAVGSVVTEKGEEQLAPKTDAEWTAIRNAAVTVAEAGNLLLLPPHARDQGDWVAMTRKMIAEANKCVQAIEAKDLETLFTAGGDMYIACSECHAKYVIGEPIKK
jgi:predicted small secreted protein